MVLQFDNNQALYLTPEVQLFLGFYKYLKDLKALSTRCHLIFFHVIQHSNIK